MRSLTWREVAAALATVAMMLVSLAAYAYEHFANKGDVESRLERIEVKIDCLLNSKLCRSGR